MGSGVLFLPFSPRWLVSKGRDAEALAALTRLRRLPPTDERVRQEWFGIRVEAQYHKESSARRHPTLQNGTVIDKIKLEAASWTDCFKRGCWRRTHVGVGIMFFQQMVSYVLVLCSPLRSFFQCSDKWEEPPISKDGIVATDIGVG